jgi:hypothetical protein
MRRLAYLILGMLVAGFAGSAASSGPGQSLDEDLRIYAVNVVKTPPLWHRIIEYGIYLGQGIVITARSNLQESPARSKTLPGLQ